MDKEEVRKLIGELRSVIYDTNGKEDVDEANLTIALAAISKIESELSKSDWVSVKDGTPKLDELVVACNENRPDNWWETFRDSEMSDEWKDENGFPIEEKVTHWKRIEKLKK